MLMKTTSMIILGEDLGEEDEVGGKEGEADLVSVGLNRYLAVDS